MNPLDPKDVGALQSGAPCFSLANRLWRALWIVAWATLAGWTPPPLHAWRRFVLRAFGAKLGRGARVHGSVRIWDPRNLVMHESSLLGPRTICYNQGLITIGRWVVVSQGSHLCSGTHDTRDPLFQLVTRPIVIEAEAWIAADAFVGPGVRIGEGAVLGACGVAMRNLAAWTIYSGNPAVPLGERVMFNQDVLMRRLASKDIA